MPDKERKESDKSKEGNEKNNKDAKGTTDNLPKGRVAAHAEWQKPPHP
jgi:hypothetical protein